MLVNSSVDIFCNIDQPDAEGRNSSHLFFEKRSGGRVPHNLINIVNATTIRLHLEHASENDSDLYQCYATNVSGPVRGIGMSQVSIGKKII